MTKKNQKRTKESKINLNDFEMLYDHILVKPIKAESIGPLVRPSQYDDKTEYGVVVKCGDGRLLDDGTIVPLKVKPGDTIFFGKYSSSETRSEGEDYLIIRDDDVLAVKKK